MRLATVAFAACAALVMGVVLPATASATPGNAFADQTCEAGKGCMTEAWFNTGTGHIRAGQGCYSTTDGWTVYGPWEPKWTFSDTVWCIHAYDDPFYQTKNT